MTERRHGERRNMESGEACCAEVVRVSATLNVYKFVVGAVWALVLCIIPLAYYKMDQVQAAVVQTQHDVAKLAAVQEILVKKMGMGTDH